jgi:hypothetical protein
VGITARHSDHAPVVPVVRRLGQEEFKASLSIIARLLILKKKVSIVEPGEHRLGGFFLNFF